VHIRTSSLAYDYIPDLVLLQPPDENQPRVIFPRPLQVPRNLYITAESNRLDHRG